MLSPVPAIQGGNRLFRQKQPRSGGPKPALRAPEGAPETMPSPAEQERSNARAGRWHSGLDCKGTRFWKYVYESSHLSRNAGLVTTLPSSLAAGSLIRVPEGRRGKNSGAVTRPAALLCWNPLRPLSCWPVVPSLREGRRNLRPPPGRNVLSKLVWPQTRGPTAV